MSDGKSGMIAPCGVEICIGQKRMEVDPRHERIVEVVGWSQTGRPVVQIRSVRLERFHGKRGGYRLVPQ